MTATRDAAGRLLPGNSANLAGRPKHTAALAALIREQSKEGQEIVEFLRQIVNGSIPASVKMRLLAARLLLERGFGKTLPAFDASVKDPS